MPDITPNPENTLHIKNMVCNRCIMVVKSQLEQLGLHPLSVDWASRPARRSQQRNVSACKSLA